MLVAVSGSQGCGKAQPIGSKILTLVGWKNIEELIVGDKIIAPDNQESTVIGVFPQGRKPVFEITTHDGARTRASDSHLWKISTSKYTKFTNQNKSWYKKIEQVVSTSELKILVEKSAHRRKGKLERNKWGSNVSIPVPCALDFRSFTLPLSIPPYLLGCLLGDGSFKSSVIFTCADLNILQKCSQLLIQNYQMNCSTNSIDYRISRGSAGSGYPNYYKEVLEEYNLWGCYSYEKFVPNQYKTASIENRWELIQGLMDTDGTVSRNGHCSFSTTSHQLAIDVQQIIRSLGGTASIKHRTPHYKDKNGNQKYCRVAYNVNIQHPTPKKLCYTPRKQERLRDIYYQGHKNGNITLNRRVVSVEFIGEEDCICIAIDHPSQLYITDDFIVTHNTTVLNELAKLGGNVITRKTSRSILTEWNVSLSEVNNNRELTVKFQDEILKRKFNDDIQISNGPGLYYTERTFVDLFTYALVAIGKDNEYSDWLNGYYRRCMEAQQIYDQVYFLTAGHFSPPKDGVRGINDHYSRLVDMVMLDYTKRMTHPSILNVVGTADLKDRVETIRIQSTSYYKLMRY